MKTYRLKTHIQLVRVLVPISKNKTVKIHEKKSRPKKTKWKIAKRRQFKIKWWQFFSRRIYGVVPRVLSQTGEKTPDLTLPVETAGARTCGATQARAGPPATLDFHRDALWCGAWDRGTITGSLARSFLFRLSPVSKDVHCRLRRWIICCKILN